MRYLVEALNKVNLLRKQLSEKQGRKQGLL